MEVWGWLYAPNAFPIECFAVDHEKWRWTLVWIGKGAWLAAHMRTQSLAAFGMGGKGDDHFPFDVFLRTS